MAGERRRFDRYLGAGNASHVTAATWLLLLFPVLSDVPIAAGWLAAATVADADAA